MKSKSHKFYIADLYMKLNEVQKTVNGKNVSMIQARTVLLCLLGKHGLYKYSLGHGKFEYSQNLALLDQQAQNKVSENDLLI